MGALQAVAPQLGVELSPIGVRDVGEIERGVTASAHGPNDGLMVTGSSLATRNRELIVTLAARLKLPAVYSLRFFVTGGGLISFGPDRVDQSLAVTDQDLVACCANLRTISLQACQHSHAVLICRLAELSHGGRASGALLRSSLLRLSQCRQRYPDEGYG